jgi:hypothetical protein
MSTQAHYELMMLTRGIKSKVRNRDPAHVALWVAIGHGIGQVLEGVNHQHQVTRLARQPIPRAEAIAVFEDLSFPQHANEIWKFEEPQPVLLVFFTNVRLLPRRFSRATANC